MCNLSSASATTAPPRRRKVTFNRKKTSVYLVQRPTSKHEAKARWYSRKELKRIRLGIRCSIKNLELASSSSDIVSDEDDSKKEQFHWRGLELVKRGCSALESQRAMIQGVLSLQKMHKQLGLRDEETINLFASAFNRDAVLQAQETAKEDFAVAQEIYNEGEQQTNADILEQQQTS